LRQGRWAEGNLSVPGGSNIDPLTPVDHFRVLAGCRPDAALHGAPTLTGNTPTGQVNFYTVGDFKAHFLDATPLTQEEARAVVPHWARNAESNKVFDKVRRIDKRMMRKMGKKV
jgi:hypothetical protein